jgi:hypothetical protein
MAITAKTRTPTTARVAPEGPRRLLEGVDDADDAEGL